MKEELRKFVEENPKLVSMRTAGEGLYVLKYKKNVFYDNLWNDYLEECRGTIVDKVAFGIGVSVLVVAHCTNTNVENPIIMAH